VVLPAILDQALPDLWQMSVAGNGIGLEIVGRFREEDAATSALRPAPETPDLASATNWLGVDARQPRAAA
jgi:hypothetical protein